MEPYWKDISQYISQMWPTALIGMSPKIISQTDGKFLAIIYFTSIEWISSIIRQLATTDMHQLILKHVNLVQHRYHIYHVHFLCHQIKSPFRRLQTFCPWTLDNQQIDWPHIRWQTEVANKIWKGLKKVNIVRS